MKITSLKTNLFFKDKNILYNLILSSALFLFNLIYTYYYAQVQVEPIALRYSIYLGVDLIAPWYYVFLIPLMGIIIIWLNFIIAYFIFLKIKIIAYFLVISSTVLQILLLMAAILIKLLNQ